MDVLDAIAVLVCFLVERFYTACVDSKWHLSLQFDLLQLETVRKTALCLFESCPFATWNWNIMMHLVHSDLIMKLPIAFVMLLYSNFYVYFEVSVIISYYNNI